MGIIYKKVETRIPVKEATEGVQLSSRTLCGLCQALGSSQSLRQCTKNKISGVNPLWFLDTLLLYLGFQFFSTRKINKG